MNRLEHIAIEELWDLLDALEGSTETQRVLAAIAHKRGDSTRELAHRHNVSQQTIRNWIARFEERPIGHAPFDEDRSGRPRKLTEEDREQLADELKESPQAVGYDQCGWSPRLVSQHLQNEYGVEYSLRHVRRLLREAGVSQ